MSAAVFEMSSIRWLISVRKASLDWEESTKPISPVIRTTTAHRTTTAVIVRLRLFFSSPGHLFRNGFCVHIVFCGKQDDGCPLGQVIFPGYYTPGGGISQGTGKPCGRKTVFLIKPLRGHEINTENDDMKRIF